MVLEKGKVATTPFSEGFLVLHQIINELQGSENKKEVISDLLSMSAPLIEKSSNSFKSDLLKINELKPLFDEWWSKRGSTEGKDPG